VVRYGQEDQTERHPSTIMKLEPGGRFVFLRK
jgi:hypothetical protein